MKFIKAIFGIPILVHSKRLSERQKNVNVLRELESNTLPLGVVPETMKPLTIEKMSIMSKSAELSEHAYKSPEELEILYNISMNDDGMCHEEGDNCVLYTGEHYGTTEGLDRALLINQDSYCFVAFKGSQGPSWKDWDGYLDWWQQNFDTKPVKLEPRNSTIGESCLVAQGFWDAYHGWADGKHIDKNREYRKELETWIDACMRKGWGKQLILTGHSQGGAVSTVASIANAHHSPLTIPHAAPPVLRERCNWLEGDHYWRTINTLMKDNMYGMDYDAAPFQGSLTNCHHVGETLVLAPIEEPPFKSAKYFDSIDPERYQNLGLTNVITTEFFAAHKQESYTKKTRGLLKYAEENGATEVKISGFPDDSGCQYEFECDSGRCDLEKALGTRHKCFPAKENGESCNEEKDCKSGRCELFKCVDIGKIGDSCSNDLECESERCESDPILFRCVEKGKQGDSCSEDDDCERGLDCRGLGDWKCEPEISPIGTSCSRDSDCESNRCAMDGVGWKCVEKGKLGETCKVSDDCESNRCEANPILWQCVELGNIGDTCSDNDECNPGLDCRGLFPWTCQKGLSPIGVSCSSDGDCASKRCEMNGVGWKCVEKGKIGETCTNDGDCEDNLECKSGLPWRCQLPKNPDGATCTRDSDCESDRCERYFGEGLKCTSRGKKGDSCSNDGDCAPGLECKGWFDWNCE